MRSAFIDSGAFIAFMDRSDQWHDQVDALFAAPPKRLLTSVLVVAETYGWMLHRMGEDSARAFRALVSSLPGLELVVADSTLLDDAGRKLDALRGRKLSLVDASSLVILEARHIPTAWGTDHHLGLEGALVTPGPSRR